MSVMSNAPATTAMSPRYTLRQFVLYFLRLGTLGFGGPIALAGYMQRDLVEERGWIAPEDYKQGLALAQLAPGPLAAQLAIYLGWVRGRVWGATLIAVAFIGPSFVMVVGLSVVYVRFGGLPWMRAVFYGVGAAVIAIIARSALKLVRMTQARDRLLWLLFAISMLVTAWTETEVVWLFAACGIAPMLARGRRGKVLETNTLSVATWPLLFAGSASASLSMGLLGTIFGYFAGAALFVFGSGLAIVPFLHGGVVLQYHWLTERQFLDAVAVSMITPGPVVITVAFIGYLVAGPLGAVAAAAGVFLPTYLVVVTIAPSFRRIVGNDLVKSFVSGVTAAATGAIAGAVIVLGRRALVDIPTILIGLATFGLLLVPRKIPEPLIIAAAGAAGLLLTMGRSA
jgi:chromate transporter